MKITRRQLRRIITEEMDMINEFDIGGFADIAGGIVKAGADVATQVLSSSETQRILMRILGETDAVTLLASLFPGGQGFLDYLEKKGVDKNEFALTLLGNLIEKDLLTLGPPPGLQLGSDDIIADAVVETLEESHASFGLWFGIGAEKEKEEVRAAVKKAVKPILGIGTGIGSSIPGGIVPTVALESITRSQLRRIITEEMESLIKEEDYDCIRDCLGSGYSRRECRDQCGDSTSHDRHPLDVDGDGKLTVSEMKISRRQLERIIKEELNEADNDIYSRWITQRSPRSERPAGSLGPLGNLKADILDTIGNAAGQIDRDVGPTPMTREDIIDFVKSMLDDPAGAVDEYLA
jgi:hypothetical protein